MPGKRSPSRGEHLGQGAVEVGNRSDKPNCIQPQLSRTAKPDQPDATAGTARVERVRLADICDYGGAQMRVEMRPEVVTEYAADMLAGATFPPVILFQDGKAHWLADGFHRVEAARKAAADSILAEIRTGTARDAILYAVGANAAHGLRRTHADKRRAIERLLTDPEWAKWSDRKIADVARVDHKTVAVVRRELLGGEFPSQIGKPVGKGPDGEFPSKPKQASNGSLVADLLRTIADSELIAECRRRRLTVVGAGDA
jgi:hypothetical protein